MGCAASIGVARVDPGPREKTHKYIIEKHRVLVKKTWKYLTPDMTAIGSQVFLRIFHIHPAIKQLFPCRDKEGKELLQDSNFKGHASRFMQAVGAVVDNMDDLDAHLSPLLIGLGRQHVNFNGFTADNFEAFTEAMKLTWAERLGVKFAGDVEAAWTTVFNFIMMKLKEGYAQAAAEMSHPSTKPVV